MYMSYWNQYLYIIKLLRYIEMSFGNYLADILDERETTRIRKSASDKVSTE